MLNHPATGIDEPFLLQDTYPTIENSYDSRLRTYFESIGIHSHDDWSSRFDPFPVFHSHSIGSGVYSYSDLPDLIKSAYSVDVHKDPFFSVKPEAYTVNGSSVDLFTRFDYQFFPALVLFLLGAPNPYKTGKKLIFKDPLTVSSFGVLPFESIFFLSPLHSHLSHVPHLYNYTDRPQFYFSQFSSPFYPFKPVHSEPLFTQVVERNGRKYFPFRITPRFSFVRDGRVYSQPSRFGGDTFYRFLDSNPSFSNQYLTYEEHLLHPYGIVYLDEKYILSHLEFVSGFQTLQLSVDTSASVIHFNLPYLYDVNFASLACPYSTFSTVQDEFVARHNDSLTLSDYLDLPFSPPQYN